VASVVGDAQRQPLLTKYSRKKTEKKQKLVKTLQVKTGTALVYIGQAKTCDGNYAAVHLQVRQEPG